MSEEQTQEVDDVDGLTKTLKDVFDQLDEDGSGRLCAAEVKTAIQSMGHNPTEEQLQDTLQMFDTDGDGELTFEEFKGPVMELIKHMCDPETAKSEAESAVDIMMQAVDTDGNGFVTKQEFADFVMNNGQEKMSQEEVDQLFQDLDADESGQLTREELIDFLTPIAPTPDE